MRRHRARRTRGRRGRSRWSARRRAGSRRRRRCGRTEEDGLVRVRARDAHTSVPEDPVAAQSVEVDLLDGQRVAVGAERRLVGGQVVIVPSVGVDSVQPGGAAARRRIRETGRRQRRRNDAPGRQEARAGCVVGIWSFGGGMVTQVGFFCVKLRRRAGPGRAGRHRPGERSVSRDHRLEHVDLGGRPGRTDRREHAGDGGERDVHRDLRAGDRDRGDALVLERLGESRARCRCPAPRPSAPRSGRSPPTPSGPSRAPGRGSCRPRGADPALGCVRTPRGPAC